MRTETFQLRELTDFIWEDYRANLEVTLGLFRACSREATSAMIRRYIANSFPFVSSLHDLCRLLLLNSQTRIARARPDVPVEVRVDLAHFDLYKRDYAEHAARDEPLDIEPFVALHKAVWRAYAATPPEYHHHLLLVLEVMSTAWLRSLRRVVTRHRLEFHFVSAMSLTQRDYTAHLAAHREVLDQVLPQATFWSMRSCYDEVASGLIDWFSHEAAAAARLRR